MTLLINKFMTTTTTTKEALSTERIQWNARKKHQMIININGFLFDFKQKKKKLN